MDADEVELAGGNSTPVIRRGNRVLRATGVWTPAVHALLTRLEQARVTGVPRLVGVEGDREVLSFLPGVAAFEPLPAWVWTRDNLHRVARLMRSIHDASVPLLIEQDAQDWVWRGDTREPVEVICHSDVAPYNTIFDADGKVRGLIDFDFAAPGPRAWDLAYAAYRYAPLTSGQTTAPFELDARVERVALLLASYGAQTSVAELLPLVVDRLSAIEAHARASAVRDQRPDLVDHAELYARDQHYVSAVIAQGSR